jgi:hypothetical protein
LTRLGVVKRGTSITLPLECLGGYEVTFDVLVTEPANIVLAEGDEVAMEFEEALDAAAAVPVAPPAHETDYDGSMIPTPEEDMPPSLQPEGRRLGGGGQRLMPDGTPWNPWRHGPWLGP